MSKLPEPVVEFITMVVKHPSFPTTNVIVSHSKNWSGGGRDQLFTDNDVEGVFAWIDEKTKRDEYSSGDDLVTVCIELKQIGTGKTAPKREFIIHESGSSSSHFVGIGTPSRYDTNFSALCLKRQMEKDFAAIADPNITTEKRPRDK